LYVYVPQEGGSGRRMSQENLLKFIDEKIKQLKAELGYYEALRQLLEKEEYQQSQPQAPPNLDQLPWRPYQKGGGEWIYRDEAPEELVTKLIKAGKPVVVNNYEYSLRNGTKGKSFISRRPVK
jgi:hypothetical protein